MSRLPETDLARIATKPREVQRKMLEPFNKSFVPRFSYHPLRSYFPDIFNFQPPIFEAKATSPEKREKATSWEKVEKLLASKCKKGCELENNLQVAKPLHDWAIQKNIESRDFDPPLTRDKLCYWNKILLIDDGRPYVPFVDPRRKLKRLDENGRRFVFSLMHVYIRVVNPDYLSLRLMILQFDDTGSSRPLELYTDEGVKLFSDNELESMVSFTYGLWQEIQKGHEERERRVAGTSRGPLL